MEFKDVGKLLYKINSFLKDDSIDVLIDSLNKMDHKSHHESFQIEVSPHTMFKLESNDIVSILDYAFLSGDTTQGVVLDGPNKGQVLDIYDKLGVENRLLYSRVDELGFVDTKTLRNLIRKDLKVINNGVKKYIIIDHFKNSLNTDERATITALYDYINELEIKLCFLNKF